MTVARPFRLALVLSGGNALGAYQAGVYEALHERGLEPYWIVGASIGAINGAIIAGNAAEHRIERLRKLWRPSSCDEVVPDMWDRAAETWRRTCEVMHTLFAGRAGMFGPIGPLGSSWNVDPRAGVPALYDTQILETTLSALVDFDRLNDGPVRFTATAVALETGEDVVFDTRHIRVDVRHLRASAAFLTAFPAIGIEGSSLVDAGLSANLPLDPVLAEPSATPLLCIAADLMPLRGRKPTTLGEVFERMQDLTFAAQSRRTIERWQAEYARPAREGRTSSVSLVRLVYQDQEREVAGKAMDFSPRSVRERWSAGRVTTHHMLDRLDAGEISTGEPGLSIFAT